MYGYLAVALFASLVAFVVYGFDKRRAQGGGCRIPEKTLHLIAVIGGWPGALVGQKVFRHKTQKLSFQVVFWCCVLLNVIAVAGVIYLTRSA